MTIPINCEYDSSAYCDYCDHLGAYLIDGEFVCKMCYEDQCGWEESGDWDCDVYDEV